MLGLHASDFPNIEPQGYYDTLHDAPPVRAGTLHGLNLSRLVGVLTFPSFHAASARSIFGRSHRFLLGEPHHTKIPTRNT